jgi:hypothetical protein
MYSKRCDGNHAVMEEAYKRVSKARWLTIPCRDGGGVRAREQAGPPALTAGASRLWPCHAQRAMYSERRDTQQSDTSAMSLYECILYHGHVNVCHVTIYSRMAMSQYTVIWPCHAPQSGYASSAHAMNARKSAHTCKGIRADAAKVFGLKGIRGIRVFA